MPPASTNCTGPMSCSGRDRITGSREKLLSNWPTGSDAAAAARRRRERPARSSKPGRGLVRSRCGSPQASTCKSPTRRRGPARSSRRSCSRRSSRNRVTELKTERANSSLRRFRHCFIKSSDPFPRGSIGVLRNSQCPNERAMTEAQGLQPPGFAISVLQPPPTPRSRSWRGSAGGPRCSRGARRSRRRAVARGSPSPAAAGIHRLRG